jgi:hypothetical protein
LPRLAKTLGGCRSLRPDEGLLCRKALGIKSGSVVALLKPPGRFERSLASLPEGAILTRNAHQRRDSRLCFVRNDKRMTGKIASMAKFAVGRGLWLSWLKKASFAPSSSLCEHNVRSGAHKSGLIDFKISASTTIGLPCALRADHDSQPGNHPPSATSPIEPGRLFANT